MCDKFNKDVNEVILKLINDDKNILLTDDILNNEGFEKHIDNDDGEEFYYWTKEINNMYLISDCFDDNNGKFTLYLFENNIPVCKTYLDLILLTNLFTKYTE